MNVPKLAEQQELILIISVQTQNVVWKTCRERWMIGVDGEKEKCSQGNPCSQRDLVMLIMIMIWILRFFENHIRIP